MTLSVGCLPWYWFPLPPVSSKIVSFVPLCSLPSVFKACVVLFSMLLFLFSFEFIFFVCVCDILSPILVEVIASYFEVTIWLSFNFIGVFFCSFALFLPSVLTEVPSCTPPV